jgi:hypothetical protein
VPFRGLRPRQRHDLGDDEQRAWQGGEDLVDELREPIGRAAERIGQIVGADVQKNDLRRALERARWIRDAGDLRDSPARAAMRRSRAPSNRRTRAKSSRFRASAASTTVTRGRRDVPH